MTIKQLPKFRNLLNLKKDQYLLHVADLISSPNREQFFSNVSNLDTPPHYHAARALPIAREQDVVVLSAPLSEPYHKWLRSLNLSSDHVYSFNLEETKSSLAELIVAQPGELKCLLKSLPGQAVYFPFYASAQDKLAAESVLGIDFFGSDEDIALRYFDKLTFKNICRDLGLAVIDGQTHNVNPKSKMDANRLEKTVSKLLRDYKKLILRGTIGSAGRSLYTIEDPDVAELYQNLLDNKDEQVLIEPLLNVISSPNDQWVIDLKGNYKHLALSAQLFRGLKHAGNIFGQYYSERTESFIKSTSEVIVREMAKLGYRGVLGIDYIVTDEGTFPIENNARVNGSTYVHALREILEEQTGPAPCWKFFKAQTQPCAFEELKNNLSDIIYDGQKINSVFPFDCELIEQNGQVTIIIFAEDMFHIDYFQDLLSQRGIYKK